MSFILPSGYPAVDQVAPDNDKEIICRGCTRLTVQISNQAVILTFGVGDPPIYGMPEPYLPAVGEIPIEFDAVKFRAYTPAAQLPPGSQQANIKLIPRVR